MQDYGKKVQHYRHRLREFFPLYELLIKNSQNSLCIRELSERVCN